MAGEGLLPGEHTCLYKPSSGVSMVVRAQTHCADGSEPALWLSLARTSLSLARTGPTGSSCYASSPAPSLAVQRMAPCLPGSCQPFRAITPITGYKKPPAN